MASLYITPSRRLVAAAPALLLLLGLALGGTACGRAPAEKPNVLLVVISGLRADHVSAYGYRRATTPVIDSLAASGALYEQAISPAPWGLTAQASLLTGLNPSEHAAAFDHPALDAALETLPEKMKARGYATFAATTDPLTGQGNGFFQGIDKGIDVQPDQDSSPDEGAASVETALLAWLDGRRSAGSTEPFVAYIVLTNPHLPFNPPGEYRQKFLEKPVPLPRLEEITQLWIPFARQFILGITSLSPDDLSAMVSLYDGEVAYADYRLGRLVDSLRERKLLDDTLVVVTSDVGEDLADHGLLAESSRLYDSIVRVPLVMRLPGRVPGGRRVARQVQTLDIGAAVLSLTGPADGAPRPDDAMPERASAISEGRFDPTAIRFYRKAAPAADLTMFESNLLAVRTPDSKYIVTSSQRAALFDLKTDPGEHTNILSSQPERAKDLSSQIAVWQSSLKAVR